MSYLLEDFVTRIESPVVCRFDGQKIRCGNGEELARFKFEKPYLLVSINVGRDAVILELMENTRMNETAWAGDEQVGFF